MTNKLIFAESIEPPYWIIVGTQNHYRIAKRVNTWGNLPSIKQRADAKQDIVHAFKQREANAA